MPTALELSREGLERYRGRPSERSDDMELTEAETRERELVLARVREAADMLKDRFDVKRVVLFGSLAHAAWFFPDSDVDLAVEGLKDQDYWCAWALVEDIVADRPVDLVDLRTASDSLRRVVERYGVEL